MLQISYPARRGRFSTLPVSRLGLHAEAFSAYQIFLDMNLMGAAPSPIVEVVRDRDNRLLRFSGFQASYAASGGDGRVNAFIWNAGAIDDRGIALMAWSEICRPKRRLRPAEAARWYRHLERRLPPRVAMAYFGQRGLNHSSAARHLDIARSSLTRHLKCLR